MYSLYYSTIARKLGLAKISDWGVALRQTNNYDTILHENKGKKIPFTIVENTKDFWFADPLLFSDGGKTWLFVEAYSYERQKGELGVFDIINGKVENFRIIISTPTHMSYPFVFKYKEDFYMIPETGAAREIVLYKAKHFPDNWERHKVLLSGLVYRDSTVFDDDGGFKLLTYRQEGFNRFDVKYYIELFDLNIETGTLIKRAEIFDKKKVNRPAGHIIKDNGCYYRLAQKCSRVYGESIYVYSYNHNLLCTPKLNELCGERIELNAAGKVVTIHTYSQAGGYEVIDYRNEIGNQKE